MPQKSAPATREQLLAFFANLERELEQVEYFRPADKRDTMLINLRNIFHRMAADAAGHPDPAGRDHGDRRGPQGAGERRRARRRRGGDAAHAARRARRGPGAGRARAGARAGAAAAAQSDRSRARVVGCAHQGPPLRRPRLQAADADRPPHRRSRVVPAARVVDLVPEEEGEAARRSARTGARGSSSAAIAWCRSRPATSRRDAAGVLDESRRAGSSRSKPVRERRSDRYFSLSSWRRAPARRKRHVARIAQKRMPRLATASARSAVAQ